MKKIYFLVAFTILHFSLFAQSPTLDWAMKLGSKVKINIADYYSGYNICVGKDGYVYSVGKFTKSIDFNGNDQVNGYGFYILKQDNQGSIIWKKFIGASNNSFISLKLDNYDNLNLLINNSDSNVLIDSTITNSNYINLNIGFHFLRLNSQGNFIWVKSLNLKYLPDNFIVSYLFDSNNNLYSFGAFSNPVDFNPSVDTFEIIPNGARGFILKLNNDGEFVWVKTIGDSLGKCNLAFSSIDTKDNIYFSGSFSDSIDIDLGTNKQYLYKKDTLNQFLVSSIISKIDTNGNLIWVKDFQRRGNNNLTNDNQNNVIVSSYFKDSITFSNTSNQQTLFSSNNNTYFAKYNENGDFLWAKQFGNVQLYNLKTDNIDNIYSNGIFENTTFLNVDDTTIKTTSKGMYDMYLIKLDSSGNHVFNFTTGGKKDDKCFGLDVDEDFNIYMTGSFNDTIDFDPSSVVENLNCHDTVRSIFITKFNQYPLAINSVTKNKLAKIYPNPTNGIFMIDVTENAQILITNSFGQVVSKTQIKKGISTIDLQNQTTGIYFIKLQTNQQIETIKILKQ